jgi:hypothetical protein
MLEIVNPPLKEIGDWVFEQTGGVVQSGPFRGMKVLHETSWHKGALAPMLLGTHEQELHGVLEQEIERLGKLSMPVIANIGCAEGYYAVGLARRLPQAEVWAVDVDWEALAITERTAGPNNVWVWRTASAELVLSKLSLDFVFMDCEGAEIHYLDVEKYPALRGAHVLVEVHQTFEQDTGHILVEKMVPTHNVVAIVEGARNPNDFHFLCHESSLVRWLAVCENRPCRMAWFLITPKAP